MRDNIHVKHSKKYLTPQEAAELIGVRVQTLAVWRCRQKSPPYINVEGKRVIYDQDDLLAWIDSRKVIC